MVATVVSLKFRSEACTGCGRCLEVCPHAVFAPAGRKVRIQSLEACMECGACRRNCEFQAIAVDSGVGCASALIAGALTGKEVSCGCDGGCSPSPISRRNR